MKSSWKMEHMEFWLQQFRSVLTAQNMQAIKHFDDRLEENYDIIYSLLSSSQPV